MQQTRHAMLVETTHDEDARQVFTSALKSHLSSHVSPGTRDAYEQRVAPAFAREHDRPIATRHEVRRAIAADPAYQMASSLKRTAQEVMFDSVGDSVERQRESLIAKARRQHNAGGTVRTDPKLQIPRYHTAVDIHCMPGAYHSELSDDDVYAGALYDRGIFLFSMGLRGALNDDFGRSLSGWTKWTFPDFAPGRILDMGCSVGHGTLPWTDAYPDAEMHAIDVGAPMVRYGQARAAALGKTVHFSQQNAEATDFADESFDLIVSQIMIHETSSKALPRILAECHRLLKPGGLMLHMDGHPWDGETPYQTFVSDWDTYFNNEPFIGPLHDSDLPAMAVRAGFDKDKVIYTTATSASRETTNKGRKEVTAGDFGYVGYFMVYGAWK